MRIIISGTVGIGKTTTSRLLNEKLKELNLNSRLLNEKALSSVYFNLFYQDPKKWAFVSQLDFLFSRFKQFLSDEKYREKQKNLISIFDRHILDDYVFAELNSINGNIESLESIIYQSIYKEMLEKMHRLNAVPDIFVLLKAPFDDVISRLKKRGRDEEITTNLEYWELLYKNYYERPMFRNHFKSNSKHFLEIDNSNKTVEEVVQIILDYIKKIM